MKENQLIYSGKAKDLYSTADEQMIRVVYKDQVTMLNGLKKEVAIGKGALNNKISSLLFTKLNQAGISTHFIKQLSETEQLNQRVTIIPLEVVLRNVAAGSFCKRFGLPEGQPLSEPIIEFYYKQDALDDPLMNEDHIRALAIADQATIEAIKAETKRINHLLKAWFASIDLQLVDFKLEFGFAHDQRLLLADEFSPDNCRLWDRAGRHMDKDVFRRDLGNLVEVYQAVYDKLKALDEA
ncbi:MAG: phosphoribosylaminoimidazolesuccinocarboxamide synthase [Streptococcus pyogenes]|nr:MAG: phosphoribosylaminoimidazolesuccinocarboxamide synthase [Streptococcus pyogenes]